MMRQADWKTEPASTDKTITDIERYVLEKPGPIPDRDFIDVHTFDGWTYRFKRLRNNEPFEFLFKRSPDGKHNHGISDDNIVPYAIADWFDRTPAIELADAHTIDKNP